MGARRVFLAVAAGWDIAVGVALLLAPEGRGGVGTVVPTGRTRVSGGVVLLFAVLYALLAAWPSRPWIIASAVAKTIGGGSGAVGLAQGRRDVVTLLSLADAVWLPGFVLAARRDCR